MKKNRLSGMVYDEVSFVDKGACEDEDGNGAHVLLVKRDPDSHLAGRRASPAASRYGSADAAERRTPSRPTAKKPTARTSSKKPAKRGTASPASPWGLAGRKGKGFAPDPKKGGGGGSKRAANWKEERHKRAAAGSPAGGEFSTTSSDSKKKYGKGGTTVASLKTKKPSAKVAAPAAKGYQIKRGETLWGLAEKFYGSGTLWRRIAQANGISDPRKVSAGKMLKIPPKGTPNKTVVKKPVKKLSMQDFRSYIVGM